MVMVSTSTFGGEGTLGVWWRMRWGGWVMACVGSGVEMEVNESQFLVLLLLVL